MIRGGARAVVLEDDRSYFASDSERWWSPVRPDALYRPGDVLDAMARLFPDRGGTLILAPQGDPRAVLKAWADARGGLAEAGWKCTTVEPWTTWTRPDSPRVHVGVLGLIQSRPTIEPDTPRVDVARRLAWYAASVGAPWHMTAGVSAHAAIREWFRGRPHQPYWGTSLQPRGLDDDRAGSGDMIWRRRAMAEDVAAGWVHSFDMRAARLAAMGVADLAYDRLVHDRGAQFDPAMAGYWRIHAADVPKPWRAMLVTPGPDGMCWPTTPVMQWLNRAGINPAVTDAWIAPGKRLFRGIATRWDWARLEAHHWRPAEERAWEYQAIQATYREGCGMFAKWGGSIFRADWYHTIMDRQRVTVLDHITRIQTDHGLMPIAVQTDRLWYASPHRWGDTAAEALGLDLGSRLGTFRVQSSAPAGEFFRQIGAPR